MIQPIGCEILYLLDPPISLIMSIEILVHLVADSLHYSAVVSSSSEPTAWKDLPMDFKLRLAS